MTDIDLEAIETPVGFVDLERVRENARRASVYAAENGLGWRPHIKTHKSLEVARIQLDAGARGLTVATPREAEVMSTLTDDILLAYPPLGASKLGRIMDLSPSVDLKVALDSIEVARGLAAAATTAKRTVGVLVEQDMGMGRVGLPDAAAVVELARAVEAMDGLRFRGIMFYPGHIRVPTEEQADGLADVAGRVDQTLGALRAADLDPEIVSGGSTPTMFDSHQIPGQTEIRAGSCIYFDREGLALEIAKPVWIAYTVLATVVSTAVRGHAVLDCGSKALAKEARGGDEGYGVVFERPEVVVSSVSEEHGVLDLSGTDWRPSIGERVRVIPNHVCVSVNLQDALVAKDGNRHRMLELQGRGRGPWSG